MEVNLSSILITLAIASNLLIKKNKRRTLSCHHINLQTTLIPTRPYVGSRSYSFDEQNIQNLYLILNSLEEKESIALIITLINLQVYFLVSEAVREKGM